jgi:DNA-binding transcriptional LysR family regulator
MDWDDLRFFLALYREGAVRPAAAKLRVSHSTVTRRIQAFEENLDTRVFDRTPDGFALTQAGEQILEIAQNMEEEAASLERTVLGRDRKLEGSIRVTMPNAVLRSPMIDGLTQFTADYPEIDLHIVESYDFADLSRREADVAVRFVTMGSSPPDHLVGRKIADSHHAVYEPVKGLIDPEDPCLLGWADEGRRPSWMKSMTLPDVPVRHVISDALGQNEACAAGMGYAILSCLHAAGDKRVKKLDGFDSWPGREIWILSHQSVRDTERFRVFRDAFAQIVRENKPLLEGELG